MVDREKELRDVWVKFMAATLSRNRMMLISEAANRADCALKEYAKRFSGPEPVKGLHR